MGTHLVNALVSLADRVIVIDKQKPKKAQKNQLAVYKQLDITTGDLEEIFAKEKPQLVFHLAAHIDDRESVRHPVMDAEQNLLGSLKVFEAAKKFRPNKIIFASTGGLIYGEQNIIPVSEEAVPRPLTPYTVSKLTVERYLYFYEKIFGIPFVAIRFSNSYGPWQDGSAECGAIAIFTERLLKGQEVHINNDGTTTRDYIYIDDVVDAFLRAAEPGASGVYNIGTGIETSTLNLFEKIKEAVGSQAAPIFDEEINDLVKRSALDCTKAKKELGWRPKVAFDSGIEKTVAWYHENV